ncbi:MAG: EamA family transporter [Ignavibacteriae bacterium]|nr:EamA family transporter [Ignavibacteriota bacterium]
MNSERIKIYLAFATACFVWGSTWLAIKIGLSGVPPLLGAGLRFAIAGVILWLIIKVQRIEIPMTADAKKMYGVLIFLSYSIPFAFIYWAEQYVPTGLASILFAAYPFWVGIFSHVMLKEEPLNVFKVAGIGLAFAGLVVIFAGDVHVADARTLLGMAMVVATTIMQAYSLVLVKKIGHNISPFAFNFVGMSASAVILVAMSFVLESHASVVWDAASIGSIVYLGTIGSVVVFAAYFWLLKRVQAVYLSLISFITPIVAVVLGSAVLAESLDPNVFVGAAFVLVGLLVANGKQVYGRLSEAFE